MIKLNYLYYYFIVIIIIILLFYIIYYYYYYLGVNHFLLRNLHLSKDPDVFYVQEVSSCYDEI